MLILGLITLGIVLLSLQLGLHISRVSSLGDVSLSNMPSTLSIQHAKAPCDSETKGSNRWQEQAHTLRRALHRTQVTIEAQQAELIAGRAFEQQNGKTGVGATKKGTRHRYRLVVTLPRH